MKKIMFALIAVVMVLTLAACSVSNTPAPAAVSATDTPVPATQSGPTSTPNLTPTYISQAGGSSAIVTKPYKVAVSEGWGENSSAQRFDQGYKDAFKEYGWTATFANANYDPKLQSEQIDAFVKQKPDALFLNCSDPAGITAAVQRAIDAGVPVFTSDCYIAGAKAVTQIASNNYGMGMFNMQYILSKIGDNGKIGMIGLPNNETWDLRELGARYVLRDYPNIKIVYWPYDSTGAVTAGQAITNMLTANPDIKAVWCAWDDAAMQGALAAQAAGLNDVIFTGIDGSQASFTQLQTGGDFKETMAQSVYWMSYMDVFYANEYLNGNKAPRFVVAPVYSVTKEVLDAVPSGLISWDYDMPGNQLKLGWNAVK
jgi:ribose transport system substrate-binding protein